MGARGARHQVRADYDAALRCFDLQQAVAEKIGDPAGVAWAWQYKGLLKRSQEDNEQGLLLMRKALTLYEAAGLKLGVAGALENLSMFYRR